MVNPWPILLQNMMITLKLCTMKSQFVAQRRQDSKLSTVIKRSWPNYFSPVFLTKDTHWAAVPTLRQSVVYTCLPGSVGCSSDDKRHFLCGGSCIRALPLDEWRPCEVTWQIGFLCHIMLSYCAPVVSDQDLWHCVWSVFVFKWATPYL